MAKVSWPQAQRPIARRHLRAAACDKIAAVPEEMVDFLPPERPLRMSTTAIQKRREPLAPRALPIVAYFDNDPVARGHLIGVQRFRRLPFETGMQENPAISRVVLVSLEDLVKENYHKMRVPNIRVLALTNEPFKDPRNDGAVYAYLPPDVPQRLFGLQAPPEFMALLEEKGV